MDLQNYFSDIADAIREKTGSTDKIQPKNFANEIKNIKTVPDGGGTPDSGVTDTEPISETIIFEEI